MNKQQDYANSIVDGKIPEQETFTKEEVRLLIQITLAWAKAQIEFGLAGTIHKDIPQLVSECEFKTIEEGISDVQEGIESHMLEVADFVEEWIE